MTTWTPQQSLAIQDRGHNLLVAAAAGSGKTAVLVERIIQLVRRDQVDIDRMLIVTFTQAAAGEMRARISSVLLEAMQENGPDQDYLREQVNLLNRASISTLHAFCMDVVRRYFHIVDISPSFRVGDATETDLLKLEVLEELFEAEYEQGEEDFLRLVEMYAGGRDDAPLRELVLRTYQFIQSQPDPLGWLGEKAEDFNLELEQFGQCDWVQSLIAQLEIVLAGVEEIFDQAVQIAQHPGGPVCYCDALQNDVLLVRKLRASLQLGIFDFYQRLGLIQHQRLAAAKKDVDPALKQNVQDLRDQGKKVLKELATKTLFMSPQEFCHDLRQLYPGMLCLCRLVEKFHQSYREYKTDKGLVDFNDLEHYTLEILADPLTAAEYQGQFDYIFVDEYQDSNLVQETILNRIKRENNLFLVGDVKQSIYRFRLADPTLFLQKYQTYKDPKEIANQRIDLSSNFRSRQTIIDGVNDIFSRIMSRQFGEMDYRPEVFLEYGLDLAQDNGEELDTGWLELILVDKAGAVADDQGEQEEEEEEDQAEMEPGADSEDLDDEPGDVEFEAQAAAARIREMHGQLFYDSKNNCLRPLEYRDMVVLMRATRNQAEVYFETLMAAGIPVYADADRGYFETTEMKVFLNLLHLIDNKRQDIPLLSVMRSPIGNFTVEELIEIRAGSSAHTYYEAVEEYLLGGEEPLTTKLSGFIQRLNNWKEAARFTPMDELIWQLLLETGYLHYASAMPGGMQRQANLRILLERAQQYQTTSMQGLFHFLKFIEKLESGSGDMGMAKVLSENEDVVRIMSIHKSKGLEFPVVIVAGLGRKFNLNDIRAKVMFHKELGIGPRFVDPDLRVTRDTIARIALANRIKAENLAEEMRILYVACTRPRDKLILIGTVGDLTQRVKQWNKGTSPFQLARANGLLDWLGAVVVAHPDGAVLRKYDTSSPIPATGVESEYHWLVNVIHRSRTGMAQAAAHAMEGFDQHLQDLMEAPDVQLRECLWSRLSWQYPYAKAINIPSKIAVSQVKEMRSAGPGAVHSTGAVPTDREPRFMAVAAGRGEAVLSGAARGVILHTVMQHLDLARVGSAADLDEQINSLVDREVMLAEEAALVDQTIILDFFASPLGQRVLAAQKVEREVPFNLLHDAAQVFPDLPPDREQLLLQGVIDLYFQEGEELVLVDYKSDRVTPSNRDALIDGYRVQIELYKNALEKILGRVVKASYLYLFDTGEAVLVEYR